MENEEKQASYPAMPNDLQDSVSTRELTFGEKAVGLTFNPSGSPAVLDVKRKFAAAIDAINDLRTGTDIAEIKRYYSKAISHAEDASMNAVKGVTWQY